MDWPTGTLLFLFGILTLVLLLRFLPPLRSRPGGFSIPGYLGYLWAFFLVLVVADWISFTAAVWIMGLISFRALREYFSLIDWRPADRWAILLAYLSIPFMIYLIQIDWYGFFIVSIPVYVFLVIPFLVALGGDTDKGSLLSIGAIDFGLFFCVYCLGHIAYLAYFSTWMAVLLIVSVAASNAAMRLTARHGRWPGYLVSNIMAVGLALLLRPWTGIPIGPSLFVGVLIPVLMQMSSVTIAALERDLGIGAEDLEPGRGRVLDSLQAYLFVAPIVFHYLRWTMKFGELVLGHGQ